MRPDPFSKSRKSDRLTIRKSTTLWPKPFSRQLAIENVTQAAARNALCMGIEEMEKLGYRRYFHIHDELLLIVEKKREAVLKAREDILHVFGPGHALPYGWALLMNPDDIAVSQSLWEDENDVKPEADGGFARWEKIRAGTPDCFANLS
jgi:hypothetical protein